VSIQIISKRKFRFHNPNVDLLQGGIVPIGPAVGDSAVKYQSAIFETNGTGDLEPAPEWIKKPMGPRKKAKLTDPDVDINAQNILTWKRAEADGHLMEVFLGRSTGEVSELEKTAAARQTEQAREILEGTADQSRPVKTFEELQAMKKDDLLAYAKDAFGVELDETANKSGLISAIQKAQQS
jgi:hypothetical protein